MHRTSLLERALFFSTTIGALLLPACIGDPNCPAGSGWSADDQRCVCDEGLARHPGTYRCIPPGEWQDAAVDAEAGMDDPDGSVPSDGGTLSDGALDAPLDAPVDECTSCPPPPAHGSARCDEGACGVACEAGFGAIRVGDAKRCSAFGGAYLRRASGACVDANPFTGDCTCGAFAARELRWRTDPADPRAHGMLGLCEPSTSPSDGSFGGAFVVEEEPIRRCVEPNETTGNCECPEGFAPSAAWVGRNDVDRPSRVVFCLTEEPEPGAAIVAAYTELRCSLSSSCASGETCACPAGSRAVIATSGVERGASGECRARNVICVAD